MAAIPAHEQQADTPADVLAAVQAERATADQAEVRILQLALDWAAMHEIDPASLFKSERPILLAGTGTPEVGEYCVPEFAAALHISTDAGRCLIADAIELAHRLPRVWARVQAGKLPPWRARRISSSTFCLPPEGAEYVDRHVARFAHKVGIAQLDRLVEEALVRFDPEQAEERRLSAADNRHVTIYTDQTDFNGTAHIDADLDLADALDLDAALADGAARLAELGCEDSLDARRAHALGELARGTDPTLPLPAREVVLTVHVTEVAVTGDADGPHLARVENTRSFVSVDQVRTWCGTPGTTITVKPVIDFNEHLSGTAYETPDRLVEQSALIDLRLPLVHPPGSANRLRPRHPPRRRWKHVLVQHREALPAAPPAQNSYGVGLRGARARFLPVDQPARLPGPPRPRRHPRRHPHRRPPPVSRARPHPPRPGPVATMPRTPPSAGPAACPHPDKDT